MALSLGSGDFRGGNVFKLGDTLLEVFPFQRGRGRGEATAKLPSIMFSAPSLRCSSERFDRHLSVVRPLYAGREKWKICDVR